MLSANSLGLVLGLTRSKTANAPQRTNEDHGDERDGVTDLQNVSLDRASNALVVPVAARRLGSHLMCDETAHKEGKSSMVII